MKICLLTCHNLYESKRYFTAKFAEALNRKGIETQILSWPYGPVPEHIVKEMQDLEPDLTCSFHQLPPQQDGRYFWDAWKHPHWTILVDPAFYDLELMQSPWSIISCVDRTDCELLRSYRFENVFFWPHAVERELAAEDGERGLDVVMLGTCYDPDNLRAFWQKQYSQEVSEAMDDAIEITLSDRNTSFFRALMQALAMHEIDPHEVEFDQMAYYVDSYARGIDRIQLIRSIRDAQIHVIGGKCWREEKPIEDWNYYLSRQSNVTIHPSIPYEEALEVLKHSRICLNSMPFFKNGTHERVFAALSCGSLPLTSDNIYMREIFAEGEDLLFYQFTHLDEVNGKVLSLLKDEPRRRDMAASGQRKVKVHHTWDNRVDWMQQALPPILDKIRSIKI
ncbi:MAG: glycosyltransferase [Parachlamydia sp.]|nr:glycosyltransferase [Parachlamydia sp.]